MRKAIQEELPLFGDLPDDPAPEKVKRDKGGVEGRDLAVSESGGTSAGEGTSLSAGREDAASPSGEDAPLAAAESASLSTKVQESASSLGSARALIVSIHDVSPHTRPAVERILAELEAIGVTQFSLLVVADHHRRGHMFDDPEFCRWLQARVARGDEAVIHGYFHYRDQRPSESLREKLTTRVYTKHEGEFFDIPGADAIRIVSDARAEFRKLGLDPHGFIAPAWLLSEGGELALRALEFDYTTRLATVEDFVGGTIYHSQSLVWSTRRAWRRLASRLWNRSLFRGLRENGLFRIGSHPPDIDYRSLIENH